MKQRTVSLLELIKLVDDESLSKSYVRYVTGSIREKQYRHHEIEDIASLIDFCGLDEAMCENFFYSYEAPRLNKEFDLIRVGKERVVNIELKSQPKALDALRKQLQQNAHFLKILGKEIYCFVFVSSKRKTYQLQGDNLVAASPEDVRNALLDIGHDEVNLDDAFSPSSILVSPLKQPDKFLSGDYLLSPNQSDIEKRLISFLTSPIEESPFLSLTGGPGTGKRLLLYDVAKKLAPHWLVFVVQSFAKGEGQVALEKAMSGFQVISPSELESISSSRFVLLVDDAQKLSEKELATIVTYAKKRLVPCAFSFDPEQRIFFRKDRQIIFDKLEEACGKNSLHLRYKVRFNREMTLFVSCLRDLSVFRETYDFESVEIRYEKDHQKAAEMAKRIEGYRFISFAPSENEFEKDGKSALELYDIEQPEFDNVVMVLDQHFYYEKGKLRSRRHPRLGYYYAPLLYQSIARVKNGLILIVTEKELLRNILKLFPAHRAK